MPDEILQVEDLTIKYRTEEGPLTAVSDASFTIREGEALGLVGESGCGKSTLVKSIMGGLDPNGEITSGRIRYNGTEIQNFSEADFDRDIRWSDISLIPQASMNSLDPIQTVENKALEIANAHTDLSDDEAMEKFKEMVEIVGVQESRLSDYPFEFSGGMQQRIIIALSLFLEPNLLIADEPTTALDVIMQDNIFMFLDRIKEELDTSILLVTHDMSVIFESTERMVVMHSGQVVERGSVYDLHQNPRHPYALLLQNSFPDIRYPNRELDTIKGHPPKTTGEVDYCTFADRCPWAIDDCRAEAPPTEPVGDDDDGSEEHVAACIRKEEIPELYEERRVAGGVDGD